MEWPFLLSGALLMLGLTALLYWQLSLAEGVYLGSRVVVWLYDRFAPRYDTVKLFDEKDEAWFLGGPLAHALRGVTTSLVLDVATGTARLPLALLRQPTFTGRIIGLDLSRGMLRRAAANTADHRERLTLLWQDATWLPFADEVVDAVVCLEALEFLPDARMTLSEMVRVLRPCGILLVSNRIGPGARWMPRRTMGRDAFTEVLESLQLSDVRIGQWQVDYDLVWARKSLTRPGRLTQSRDQPTTAAHRTLPELLRCPRCARQCSGAAQPSASLVREDEAFCCEACGSRYPIADDGVVELAHQRGPTA